MREYIIRFFIAGILVLFAGLWLLDVRHPQAAMLSAHERKEELIWPADGVISDTFGTRHGRHKGIDIAGKLNSPIVAVDDGVVERSYYSDSYGNVIFIHHQHNYVTVYAHLSERLVKSGQQVSQGEIIGKMGKSGQATGVHLHFETHQTEWTYDKKFALDPEGFLGEKKLGEIVLAGAVNAGNHALEASSRFHGQEENRLNSKMDVTNHTNTTYIVKQGDTLLSIARSRHIPVDAIKKINQLSSDLIKTEQILMIPQNNQLK